MGAKASKENAAPLGFSGPLTSHEAFSALKTDPAAIGLAKAIWECTVGGECKEGAKLSVEQTFRYISDLLVIVNSSSHPSVNASSIIKDLKISTLSLEHAVPTLPKTQSDPRPNPTPDVDPRAQSNPSPNPTPSPDPDPDPNSNPTPNPDADPESNSNTYPGPNALEEGKSDTKASRANLKITDFDREKAPIKAGDYVRIVEVVAGSALMGTPGVVLSVDFKEKKCIVQYKSQAVHLPVSYLSKIDPLYIWLKFTSTRNKDVTSCSVGGVDFDLTETSEVSNKVVSIISPGSSTSFLSAVAKRRNRFKDKNFSLNGSTNIIFKFPPGVQNVQRYRIITSRCKSGKDPVGWQMFGLNPNDGSWEKLDEREGLSLEMPKKRGALASYCDLQMESVAERLGLLRGRKQKHNFNMGIWVPASPPSFGRQTSFDMVVLARQKSLNERAGAEVAIAAFKAPMRTHHKVGLFLSTDREELYLQISFPKAILNMPAAVMSLITEYSGFKIKKLNIQKHAKRLYETAFKHAQANPTSKSPREVVASRILDEGVRSMLRKVFGNTKTPKPKDKKPDPKSDSKGQTESKSNASPPANSKTNPSNDLKPSKNSNEDPNSPMDDIDNVFLGASYLELQVLLAAVELLYTEITGRPYVSSDIKYLNRSDARRLSLQMSKGLEVKVAPAPIARPTRRGTAGYKGSAGEQAKVGSAIEKKKKELDKADQLATFLLCALSESISSLQTKGRLVRSHEDLIKGSVVNPIVGSLLKNNSLMQIAERPVMFMQVLRVVESICCGPSKTLPKALLGGKQKHVVDMPPLLRTLERQANVLARSTSTPTKLKPADKKGKKKRIDKDFKAAAEQNEFASEMLRILTATNLVMKTILKERAKEEQKLMIDKGDKKNSKDSGTAKIENLRRWMSDNSVRMVDVVNDTKYKHKYKASTQPPGTGRLMNRLTREVGAMMSGLPPGLALRVDEKRMDIMRAMIIGPTGGPYENGVFFFDIHTHGSYPNGPPKCSIITTGKGTFRFNANLYTRGKVCLSLLGTWSGPGWDSRYSTLVQVLLSIQAMILGVEEPIANEPGWESGVGTTRSKRYNGILKHGTMKHAMLEYLVNEPPKGFEEIVKAHFYTNKEHLLKKQLPSWLEEAKAAGNSSSGPYGHENKIDSTPDKDYNNLVQALEKLKAPEIDEEEEEGSDESDDDDF